MSDPREAPRETDLHALFVARGEFAAAFAAVPGAALQYKGASDDRSLHEAAERSEARANAIARKISITYKAGDTTRDTSAADIVGWLTDHYREHVPNVQMMAARATGR